jgi:hypothetical protein
MAFSLGGVGVKGMPKAADVQNAVGGAVSAITQPVGSAISDVAGAIANVAPDAIANVANAVQQGVPSILNGLANGIASAAGAVSGVASQTLSAPKDAMADDDNNWGDTEPPSSDYDTYYEGTENNNNQDGTRLIKNPTLSYIPIPMVGTQIRTTTNYGISQGRYYGYGTRDTKKITAGHKVKRYMPATTGYGATPAHWQTSIAEKYYWLVVAPWDKGDGSQLWETELPIADVNASWADTNAPNVPIQGDVGHWPEGDADKDGKSPYVYDNNVTFQAGHSYTLTVVVRANLNYVFDQSISADNIDLSYFKVTSNYLMPSVVDSQKYVGDPVTSSRSVAISQDGKTMTVKLTYNMACISELTVASTGKVASSTSTLSFTGDFFNDDTFNKDLQWVTIGTDDDQTQTLAAKYKGNVVFGPGNQYQANFVFTQAKDKFFSAPHSFNMTVMIGSQPYFVSWSDEGLDWSDQKPKEIEDSPFYVLKTVDASANDEFILSYRFDPTPVTNQAVNLPVNTLTAGTMYKPATGTSITNANLMTLGFDGRRYDVVGWNGAGMAPDPNTANSSATLILHSAHYLPDSGYWTRFAWNQDHDNSSGVGNSLWDSPNNINSTNKNDNTWQASVMEHMLPDDTTVDYYAINARPKTSLTGAAWSWRVWYELQGAYSGNHEIRESIVPAARDEKFWPISSSTWRDETSEVSQLSNAVLAGYGPDWFTRTGYRDVLYAVAGSSMKWGILGFDMVSRNGSVYTAWDDYEYHSGVLSQVAKDGYDFSLDGHNKTSQAYAGAVYGYYLGTPRPAFWLDLNAVLFFSKANDPVTNGMPAYKTEGGNGGKAHDVSNAPAAGQNALQGNMKATISQNVAEGHDNTGLNAISNVQADYGLGTQHLSPGQEVKVSWGLGANVGIVSYALLDSNNQVIYYGHLGSATGFAGSGSFIMPSEAELQAHGLIGTNVRLYVFNELVRTGDFTNISGPLVAPSSMADNSAENSAGVRVLDAIDYNPMPSQKATYNGAAQLPNLTDPAKAMLASCTKQGASPAVDLDDDKLSVRYASYIPKDLDNDGRITTSNANGVNELLSPHPDKLTYYTSLSSIIPSKVNGNYPLFCHDTPDGYPYKIYYEISSTETADDGSPDYKYADAYGTLDYYIITDGLMTDNGPSVSIKQPVNLTTDELAGMLHFGVYDTPKFHEVDPQTGKDTLTDVGIETLPTYLGTADNPNGAYVHWQWSADQNFTATYADFNSLMQSLGPDKSGTYYVRLQVTSGVLDEPTYGSNGIQRVDFLDAYSMPKSFSIQLMSLKTDTVEQKQSVEYNGLAQMPPTVTKVVNSANPPVVMYDAKDGPADGVEVHITYKEHSQGDDAWSDAVPQFKDAGTHYIDYKVTKVGDNAADYGTDSGTYTFTISPHDVYIDWTHVSFEKAYDANTRATQAYTSYLFSSEVGATKNYTIITDGTGNASNGIFTSDTGNIGLAYSEPPKFVYGDWSDAQHATGTFTTNDNRGDHSIAMINSEFPFALYGSAAANYVLQPVMIAEGINPTDKGKYVPVNFSSAEDQYKPGKTPPIENVIPDKMVTDTNNQKIVDDYKGAIDARPNKFTYTVDGYDSTGAPVQIGTATGQAGVPGTDDCSSSSVTYGDTLSSSATSEVSASFALQYSISNPDVAHFVDAYGNEIGSLDPSGTWNVTLRNSSSDGKIPTPYIYVCGVGAFDVTATCAPQNSDAASGAPLNTTTERVTLAHINAVKRVVTLDFSHMTFTKTYDATDSTATATSSGTAVTDTTVTGDPIISNAVAGDLVNKGSDHLPLLELDTSGVTYRFSSANAGSNIGMIADGTFVLSSQSVDSAVAYYSFAQPSAAEVAMAKGTINQRTLQLDFKGMDFSREYDSTKNAMAKANTDGTAAHPALLGILSADANKVALDDAHVEYAFDTPDAGLKQIYVRATVGNTYAPTDQSYPYKLIGAGDGDSSANYYVEIPKGNLIPTLYNDGTQMPDEYHTIRPAKQNVTFNYLPTTTGTRPAESNNNTWQVQTSDTNTYVQAVLTPSKAQASPTDPLLLSNTPLAYTASNETPAEEIAGDADRNVADVIGDTGQLKLNKPGNLKVLVTTNTPVAANDYVDGQAYGQGELVANGGNIYEHNKADDTTNPPASWQDADWTLIYNPNYAPVSVESCLITVVDPLVISGLPSANFTIGDDGNEYYLYNSDVASNGGSDNDGYGTHTITLMGGTGDGDETISLKFTPLEGYNGDPVTFSGHDKSDADAGANPAPDGSFTWTLNASDPTVPGSNTWDIVVPQGVRGNIVITASKAGDGTYLDQGPVSAYARAVANDTPVGVLIQAHDYTYGSTFAGIPVNQAWSDQQKAAVADSDNNGIIDDTIIEPPTLDITSQGPRTFWYKSATDALDTWHKWGQDINLDGIINGTGDATDDDGDGVDDAVPTLPTLNAGKYLMRLYVPQTGSYNTIDTDATNTNSAFQVLPRTEGEFTVSAQKEVPGTPPTTQDVVFGTDVNEQDLDGQAGTPSVVYDFSATQLLPYPNMLYTLPAGTPDDDIVPLDWSVSVRTKDGTMLVVQNPGDAVASNAFAIMDANGKLTIDPTKLPDNTFTADDGTEQLNVTYVSVTVSRPNANYVDVPNTVVMTILPKPSYALLVSPDPIGFTSAAYNDVPSYTETHDVTITNIGTRPVSGITLSMAQGAASPFTIVSGKQDVGTLDVLTPVTVTGALALNTSVICAQFAKDGIYTDKVQALAPQTVEAATANVAFTATSVAIPFVGVNDIIAPVAGKYPSYIVQSNDASKYSIASDITYGDTTGGVSWYPELTANHGVYDTDSNYSVSVTVRPNDGYYFDFGSNNPKFAVSLADTDNNVYRSDDDPSSNTTFYHYVEASTGKDIVVITHRFGKTATKKIRELFVVRDNPTNLEYDSNTAHGNNGISLDNLGCRFYATFTNDPKTIVDSTTGATRYFDLNDILSSGDTGYIEDHTLDANMFRSYEANDGILYVVVSWGADGKADAGHPVDADPNNAPFNAFRQSALVTGDSGKYIVVKVPDSYDSTLLDADKGCQWLSVGTMRGDSYHEDYSPKDTSHNQQSASTDALSPDYRGGYYCLTKDSKDPSKDKGIHVAFYDDAGKAAEALNALGNGFTVKYGNDKDEDAEAASVKAMSGTMALSGVDALDAADGSDGTDDSSVNIGNAIGVIVSDCDSNNNNKVDIDDAVVKAYKPAQPIDDQPQIVKDTFNKFGAYGTLADNYDKGAWNDTLYAYLEAWADVYDCLTTPDSLVTPTDLDNGIANVKQSISNLRQVHARLEVGTSDDIPANGDITLDAYDQNIQARFSGFIGSVDTSKPLSIGEYELSIVPNGDKAYKLMDGDTQVGTITQGSTDVSIDASWLDSLPSSPATGYEMNVPFADNLTGNSRGSVWINVHRTAQGVTSGSNDMPSGMPNDASAGANGSTTPEMSGAAGGGASGLQVLASSVPFFNANSQSGDSNDQLDASQAAWISAGLWVLLAFAAIAAAMFVLMRRRKVKDDTMLEYKYGCYELASEAWLMEHIATAEHELKSLSE